jgi:hypothetical protein
LSAIFLNKLVEVVMKNKRLYEIVFLGLTLMFVIMPRPGYSQSPGPATAGTVEVAAEMAPAPANCGPVPEPLQVDSQIGAAIGAWPIWVGLPARDGRAVIAYSNQKYNANSTLPGWWSTKVGWFIKKTYHGEVKLYGYNVADHSPIYFDIGPDATTTTPTINPDHPGGFISGMTDWAFFPSLVWISKAGCYTLVAEWDGGTWHQTVPAGYVEGW